MFFLIFITATLFSCVRHEKEGGPYFGNGLHNGWADQNSITIWTRLTKNPELKTTGAVFNTITPEEAKELAGIDKVELLHRKQIPDGLTLEDMLGACQGMAGEVRLSYWQDDAKNKIETDWVHVDTLKNYTYQWKLTDLLPNTVYRLELLARKNQTISDTISGMFRTAPESSSEKKINFGMVSCHDYNRKDLTDGHKIYRAMAKDDLDFFVHTGDIEYYDKPNPYALTEQLMRFKWDRIFGLPLQRDFFAKTTTYFMKDDHDVLRDDAYQGMTYGAVSFERGIEIFDREQFPSNDKTYKTIRWGKDLQIWLLEGRKYRSKNTAPDGPEKSILGEKQRAWLFETIDRSNATFKVIISASPILGPDRPTGKNDNHSNEAYRYEGNIIREFVNRHDNVFMCNGDRHWQYVSHIENSNLWEFGTGAGSDSHAGGWEQNNVLPEHLFLRVKGGYLTGRVFRENEMAKLKFEHRDVDGNVVYTKEFSKKVQEK